MGEKICNVFFICYSKFYNNKKRTSTSIFLLWRTCNALVKCAPFIFYDHETGTAKRWNISLHVYLNSEVIYLKHFGQNLIGQKTAMQLNAVKLL